MSEEMFNTEKDYGITMAIAKSMLEKGLITISEYDQFNEEMMQKYKPKLASLFAILPWLYGLYKWCIVRKGSD